MHSTECCCLHTDRGTVNLKIIAIKNYQSSNLVYRSAILEYLFEKIKNIFPYSPDLADDKLLVDKGMESENLFCFVASKNSS